MEKTNHLLIELVERYQYHQSKVNCDNPFVAGVAQKMCDIDVYEMYMLTQGRLS